MGSGERIVRMIRDYVYEHDQHTYESLANEWGCSKNTVGRFLNGEATPSGGTMLRIIAWCMEAKE